MKSSYLLLLTPAIVALAFTACGGSTDVEIGNTGEDVDSGIQQEAGPDSITPTHEAGPDTASPDSDIEDSSTNSDGGATDAQTDSGQADALPVDGGDSDALPPVDGGNSDAQPVDGGDPDAQPPVDAGPPKEKCGDNIDNDGDGQTDEDGAEGCVKVYTDGDHDGFGQFELRCTCPPPTLGPNETTNGTDCYDGNKDAYPNSQIWALVNRGDGSFDYNCDGNETKRYTNKGSCERVFGGCKVHRGWLKPQVPECGKSAPWLTKCKVVGLKDCAPDGSKSKAQECQ